MTTSLELLLLRYTLASQNLVCYQLSSLGLVVHWMYYLKLCPMDKWKCKLLSFFQLSCKYRYLHCDTKALSNCSSVSNNRSPNYKITKPISYLTFILWVWNSWLTWKHAFKGRKSRLCMSELARVHHMNSISEGVIFCICLQQFLFFPFFFVWYI